MGLLCKQAEASSLITPSPLLRHFFFFWNSRKGSIYFRVAHRERPRSTYWTRICRVSPGSAGVQLIWRSESGMGGFERRSRCAAGFLPLSAANSHDWCATSSSSPQKNEWPSPQWDPTTCQDIFWGGVIELFVFCVGETIALPAWTAPEGLLCLLSARRLPLNLFSMSHCLC